MKILHVGAHDACGSGYWLSRAINRHTEHQAANIRFVDDWSRTPAYIWASRYARKTIKQMIYKADVVHFSINVAPYFSAFDLKKRVMNKKKILVYYHGSVLRSMADVVVKGALECAPDHIVTVSTPDLFAHLPMDLEAYWLPVIRDFEYIQTKYGFEEVETKAAAAFGKRQFMVIGHPTSNVRKHGSKFFFACLTDIMRINRNTRSSIIINTPWDACMRKFSQFDVVLGNASKIGTYGLTCVEAGIFKIPACTWLTEESYKLYEKLAGSPPPLITWHSLKDLFNKLQGLYNDPKMRVELGQQLHDWMRPIHDEKAVVAKYMQMITNKR